LGWETGKKFLACGSSASVKFQLEGESTYFFRFAALQKTLPENFTGIVAAFAEATTTAAMR